MGETWKPWDKKINSEVEPRGPVYCKNKRGEEKEGKKDT